MLKATLMGANGKEWLLTGTQFSSEVLAPLGVLQSLVGVSSRSDVAIPGRAGVIPGQPRYGVLETSIDFYLNAGERTLEEVYKDFRQAWNLWSAKSPTPTTIKIEADHGLSPLFFDLWLSQPIPGAAVDMRTREAVTVTVNVFSPLGLAKSAPVMASGIVTVTNTGDVLIYPKIRWNGAGGEVTSPSGATFTLPSVSEPTVISLSPRSLRLDGAFPEGVPPGESKTWSLPAGASMSWEILVADPWA